MYSTQMKRLVQIVKCIYQSEPREQSIIVFMTIYNNCAKTCFREVMLDFKILL